MSILSVARVGLSKVGPGIMKGLRGWGNGIKEAFKGLFHGLEVTFPSPFLLDVISLDKKNCRG